MTDLSVIIVSWNTRELVKLCINSVIDQLDKSVGPEIIVIDNASSDGTPEMIAAEYPNVHLIRNRDNVGFANAVNQGAKVAGGRYFLLLNSDARLRDGGISRLIKALDRETDIGIAVGRMVDGQGRSIPAYYRFPNLFDLIKSYTFDRIYKVGHQTSGCVRKCERNVMGMQICDVDWVSGGYLLARRELLTADGLFDRRIFMYFEDSLLCKRAWESGYRVVFIDDAPVMHECGASAKKIRIKATQFSYESSRLYVQAMYGDAALKRYETINRGLWRLLVLGLWTIEKLGLGRLAKPKRGLFEHLLSVPRIT